MDLSHVGKGGSALPLPDMTLSPSASGQVYAGQMWMLGTLLHLAATLAHGAAPSSNARPRFLSNRLPSRVIRAGSCAELGYVT